MYMRELHKSGAIASVAPIFVHVACWALSYGAQSDCSRFPAPNSKPLNPRRKPDIQVPVSGHRDVPQFRKGPHIQTWFQVPKTIQTIVLGLQNPISWVLGPSRVSITHRFMFCTSHYMCSYFLKITSGGNMSTTRSMEHS